jgi:RNA ligase (TIGR02306 family)
MSDHTIEVVRIREIEPHPNADTLGIVRVHGYTCCVRLGEWQPGDLVAYIIPDSIVDTTRPEFAFLEGHPRIKVKRLRGVYSRGLLVHAPEGLSEGDDAAEALGITHYEPEATLGGGDSGPGPAGFRPKYEVESLYRFPDLLFPGEEVVATEKLHGANARYCYADGRFWSGGKTGWKTESANSPWWRALKQCQPLLTFLEAYPNLVAYGEIYGAVQDLKYGTRPGEIRLALFDFWDYASVRYLDFDHAYGLAKDAALPWVPVLWRGPYAREAVLALADGESAMPGAKHLREGIVVRPVVERMDPARGRVHVKIVSNRYLEKA